VIISCIIKFFHACMKKKGVNSFSFSGVNSQTGFFVGVKSEKWLLLFSVTVLI
jgi:hypothetical protein